LVKKCRTQENNSDKGQVIAFVVNKEIILTQIYNNCQIRVISTDHRLDWKDHFSVTVSSINAIKDALQLITHKILISHKSHPGMVLSHMSIIEQVFLIGQELVTDYDMGIFSPEVSAHLSLVFVNW